MAPAKKRKLQLSVSKMKPKPAVDSEIAVATIDDIDIDSDSNPTTSSTNPWKGNGLPKQGETSVSETYSPQGSSVDDTDFDDSNLTTGSKNPWKGDGLPKEFKISETMSLLYSPPHGTDDDNADKDDTLLGRISPWSMEMEESDDERISRKNIRKIMKTSELAFATRTAEKEEKARVKRLAEKQKLFEGIRKTECGKIERLILEVDPNSKKPLIEVDKSIVKHLKPHQAEGIRFMYNSCFESIEMIQQDKVPGGCILAHCMGLGKTLQSVALIHTLLTNKLCGIKTVLVLFPLNTAINWFNELKRWTKDTKEIKIHKLYEMKNTPESRLEFLNAWQRRGGVGLLNYDMFRRLADPKKLTKMNPTLREAAKQALVDPGPDLVICDEGHLLKNSETIISLSVEKIRTRRRIILTGTPLQNNLIEYYNTMNLVKSNLLGSQKEFTNRFVNPIINGQHADSTESDVTLMKRRAHVLHQKLEGCVQRCDYSFLAPYLPPKHEYIINVALSKKQEELYRYYLNNVILQDSEYVRKTSLLRYCCELVKVWSHPLALTVRRVTKYEEMVEKNQDNPFKAFDETFSDESMEIAEDKTEASAGNDLHFPGLADDEEYHKNKWWRPLFEKIEDMSVFELSGKLVILKEILQTSESIGDKVLVFSQFLTSLDIIEDMLKDWDKAAVAKNAKGDEKGRWRNTIEFFRIDGSTKLADRQQYCEKFNRTSSSSKAKVFMISTKAGGLGINLHGANRVVLFDVSWNPSQDKQGIFRVYRFGQDKPCYIYRLVARGTMEEKILRRQITKLSLSSRVVDEEQVERHFNFNEVYQMYEYVADDPLAKPEVLAVPKDALLADLILSHGHWIRSYQEFDSLLENRPDEGLTNEEKEMAWEEYRNDEGKPGEGDQPDFEDFKRVGPRRRRIRKSMHLIHQQENGPSLDPAQSIRDGLACNASVGSVPADCGTQESVIGDNDSLPGVPEISCRVARRVFPDFSKRSHQARGPIRRDYTDEEDRLIIQMIINKDAIRYTKGRKMWQQLAESAKFKPKRPWSSLENRWRKSIVKTILRDSKEGKSNAFNISDEQLNQIQEMDTMSHRHDNVCPPIIF